MDLISLPPHDDSLATILNGLTQRAASASRHSKIIYNPVGDLMRQGHRADLRHEFVDLSGLPDRVFNEYGELSRVSTPTCTSDLSGLDQNN